MFDIAFVKWQMMLDIQKMRWIVEKESGHVLGEALYSGLGLVWKSEV